MQNIEKIRQMSVDELAAFLEEINAETPPDFCDRCEQNVRGACCDCPYIDDKAAWKDWLQREE